MATHRSWQWALTKESNMRRRPLVLVIALSAALFLSASPLAAWGVSQLWSPPLPAPVAAHTSTRVGVLTVFHHRNIPVSATELGLVVTARSMGVTVGQLRQKWQHVANCEVGGNWSMTGPVYSGIGFLNGTWSAFGGRQYAPLAGQATRDQQILIGMKVTNGWIPDQNGCAAW
jgi:Transglycosylase-like domain